MKITVTRAKTKQSKSPQVGDEKVVDGIKYVRQHRIIDDPIYGKCMDKTGGRYHYEWVKA